MENGAFSTNNKIYSWMSDVMSGDKQGGNPLKNSLSFNIT